MRKKSKAIRAGVRRKNAPRRSFAQSYLTRVSLLPWLGLFILLGSLAGLYFFKGGVWFEFGRGQQIDTIVLDAGHGGEDPGASGHGQIEKVLCLDVVRQLQKQLEDKGWRVKMTRDADSTVSLAQRVQISNAEKRAIFVSIHFNIGGNVSASGIETFYFDPAQNDSPDKEQKVLSESEILAADVQVALVRRVGAVDRGIKERTLYVLRNTKNPAILVECGFLSNTMEAALASGSGYRLNLARGIAEGIQKYLHSRHAKPQKMTENKSGRMSS